MAERPKRTPRLYTPVERKMLAVLADGLPHTRAELHGCLADDLGGATAIRFHLSNLRRKLRPSGQAILCEIHNRRACYRQVRLLSGKQ